MAAAAQPMVLAPVAHMFLQGAAALFFKVRGTIETIHSMLAAHHGWPCAA
jgi:hypothetical protein